MNRKNKEKLESVKPLVFIAESNSSKSILEKLELIKNKSLDLLLEGDEGTGKDHSIEWLKKESTTKLHKIHCSNWMDDWTFIANSIQNNSVLLDDLYLDKIEELDNKGQNFFYRIVETKKILFQNSSNACLFQGNIFTSTRLSSIVQFKALDFKEDLYKRLSTVKISLPKLKERKEDIPSLVNHFIDMFSVKYKKKKKKITSSLGDFLMNYTWPANISQLKSLIENLVLFSTTSTLDMRSIPKNFLKSSAENFLDKLDIVPGVSIADYEKKIIKANLANYDNNRERTADALGISSRNLYRKIKEYGL
jgi:DNA-binding NtrC family response regulator